MNTRKACLMLAIVAVTIIAIFLSSTDTAMAGSMIQEVSGGFGVAGNQIASSMVVYSGRIYVGTNNGAHGCEIWASDGSGWTQVIGGGAPGSSTAPGFGNPNNITTSEMAVFGDYLYAGTHNNNGCQIWRYDRSTWTEVVGQGAAGSSTAPGFGNPSNRVARSMAVFSSQLYAGTWKPGSGCEVWRTADGTTWTPVVGAAAAMAAGFGNVNNQYAESMAAFGSHLYVGTYNSAAGCEVWRTDGSSWTPIVGAGGVIGGGFGSLNNFILESMAIYDSALYMGTGNAGGGQVWRYSEDGSCTQIVGQGGAGTSAGPGFGNAGNTYAISMTIYDSHLYVGTYNSTAGCEVWRFDGSGWTEVVGQDPGGTWGTGPGFGNPDNWGAYVMGVFDSRIFFGTHDMNDGCEIWSTKTATTWYLAEGATKGGYETWVLVQNPNAASVGVTIKFQTGAGEVLGPTDTIPAYSRRSYLANTYVISYDVSTKVTSNGPDIICERSVYWTPPGETAKVLGHDSIGVIAPAMKWYLAEGATAGGYETWVLVQNPNSSPVDVDIKYQTQSGQIQGPAETIAAKSRKSYRVELNTYNVSTLVTSMTPGGLIICERSVYYTPAGSNHKEVGTDSIGIVEPASNWYLAEGATDGGYETWVLVQNPNSIDVNVNVKYQTTNGEVQGPIETVLARSRKSFRVNDKVKDFNVSTKVESTGGDVVCERAMYWTPPGKAQTQKVLGHDSIGVRMGNSEWYLAEGATKGGYETWVLVQNPNAAAVTIDLQFQTAAGPIPAAGDPAIRETIPGLSRRSYKVNNWTNSYDVSTRVASLGGSIICERAVYWTPAGTTIKQLGTDSIGFTLY